MICFVLKLLWNNFELFSLFQNDYGNLFNCFVIFEKHFQNILIDFMYVEFIRECS